MHTHTFARAALIAALSIATAACGGESTDEPAGNAAGSAGAAGSAAGGSGGASAGTGGTTAGNAGSGTSGQGGAAAGAGGSDAGAGGSDAGAGGTEAAGAGGSEAAGAGGSEQGGSGGSGASAPFACEGGQTVKEGLNEGWMAGGVARKFYAAFPKDKSKPMAVVFWLHGYGDTAANFKKFAPSPDTDPDFPFVIVTPEDTDLQPFGTPQGLDWALFSGKASTPNIEAALFESVNGCLAKDNTIDDKRLYVAGFSAGAILTNMLASRYQGRIAASLAFSGAWFNDPEQTKTINTFGFSVDFSWEPLTAPSTGMALITHGGKKDTFGVSGQKVIDFELCAEKANPFLLGAQRSYIDCSHNGGHTPHPDITAEVAIRYFKDHRAGEPSPYLGGKLPAEFPSSCELKEP